MQAQRLDPSHASAYRDLMLRAYAEQPQAFSSSAQERALLPLAWWEQRLGDADGGVFALLQESQPLAVCGLQFESREKLRHKAQLFGMYVDPDFRRSGYGDALLRQALEAARARPGVLVLQLSVSAGNHPALHLYGRWGFQAFASEPMAVAVAGQFVTKLHMWRLVHGD